jgi:hypothetical protein
LLALGNGYAAVRDARYTSNATSVICSLIHGWLLRVWLWPL